MKFKPLPRLFYQNDTPEVARNLLGTILVSTFGGETTAGIIIQTEAYRGDDPASHTFFGKTKRNAAMFGPCGHAYVYLSYGIHRCFDVVARSDNHTSGGVLIRMLHPLKGINIMHTRRGNPPDQQLVNGPGKVAQALDIQLHHNGIDITDNTSPLSITHGIRVDKKHIMASPRIGISKATTVNWCFSIKAYAFNSFPDHLL